MPVIERMCLRDETLSERGVSLRRAQRPPGVVARVAQAEGHGGRASARIGR